ncbi:hypothetical protein K474DRAFT_991300 [Panus rudis PR-1116 ss-1]|nr:hypothetical protein K474DRAFT_991300 [Panus rudis PR-1116 ss-1]
MIGKGGGHSLPLYKWSHALLPGFLSLCSPHYIRSSRPPFSSEPTLDIRTGRLNFLLSFYDLHRCTVSYAHFSNPLFTNPKLYFDHLPSLDLNEDARIRYSPCHRFRLCCSLLVFPSAFPSYDAAPANIEPIYMQDRSVDEATDFSRMHPRDFRRPIPEDIPEPRSIIWAREDVYPRNEEIYARAEPEPEPTKAPKLSREEAAVVSRKKSYRSDSEDIPLVEGAQCAAKRRLQL